MRILNIIGKIDIDKEFYLIFDTDNKFLITPIVGTDHYFEMSGESMYNCLLEEEKVYDKNYSEQKELIINALLERRRICNNFYTHKSLHGEAADTQLRSTSAAIRTLLLGYREHLVEKEIIQDLVEKHLLYYLNLGSGVWFCHDTSEYYDNGPKTHIKVKYLNKENRNTVTLNTHFDTMTTLSLVLKENILDNQREYLDLYNKGIISINRILSKELSNDWVDSILQKFDTLFFRRAFKGNQSVVDKLYARIIHPVFFKIVKPTLFFKNGFIGRDLAVMNIHVDYLLVNIVDILRFYKGYKSLKKDKVELMYIDEKELIRRVDLAVKLVQSDACMINFINSSDLQKAWYVEMLYLYNDLIGSKYAGVFDEFRENNLYVYKHYLFS